MLRRTVLPGALFLLLAWIMLSPLAYDELPDSPQQDLANHVGGVVEAANALREGQFPIRVAPHQNDGERYPVFQFYGNLPYTAGGLLRVFAAMDPYAALKLVLLASLTAGGYFTYLGCRLLTRRVQPSVVGGVVFVTAPYLLADIHARAAFPETVSFCLLPAVFYFTARCLQSRRLAFVVCAALAWSALGLSHNITFLFGSLFVCAWYLTFARFDRTFVWRMARVGGAYGLGLLLNAWYIAPQFATLPDLVIARAYWSVQDMAWVSPLNVLLAPTLVLPAPYPRPMDNTRFGLQVGWPILAAAGLAGYYVFGGPSLARRERHTLLRLLLLGGAALLLVWSPCDVWRWLPRLFGYVQFSYRLLMFVVLCGSLLAACVLSRAYPGGMRPVPFLACICVPVVLAGPYLPAYRTSEQVSVAKQVREPDMGGGGANDNYRLAAGGPVDTLRPLVDASGWMFFSAEQTRLVTRFGRDTVCRCQVAVPSLVQLPVLFYPGLLRVRVNGVETAHGSLGGRVAVALPAGEHVLEVRFVGCAWANRLSAAAWVGVLGGLFFLVLLPYLIAVAEWMRRRGILANLPLPVHAAGLLLVSGASLAGAAGLLRATVFAPPLVSAVTASSTLSPLHEAAHAIDGREVTAWAAASPEPAWLQLHLRRAVSLHSLEFLARGTHLHETWRQVRVRLYRDGALVLDRPFSFPDAATQRLQTAHFPATRTDHIELFVSEPVTQTPAGRPVDRQSVRPGFAEVRLGYE